MKNLQSLQLEMLYVYNGLTLVRTAGSNIVKIAFRNPPSGNSPLSVYFLGITTGVTQNSSIEYHPDAMSLAQNYPNPFNPSTMIQYSIPHADNVSIEIFNLQGKLIKSLLSEKQEAGEHYVPWQGTDNKATSVASGSYFYVVKVGNTLRARKMILLK